MEGHTKVDIPKFKGNANLLLDWLLQVDSVFTYKKYSDPKPVQYVETKLRGLTLNWWTTRQQACLSHGFPRVQDWHTMKQEIFIPKEYYNGLARHKMSLTQGDLFFGDYTDKLHLLVACARMVEDRISRFGVLTSRFTQTYS